MKVKTDMTSMPTLGLGDLVVDRDLISTLTDSLTIDTDATVDHRTEDDGYTGQDDEPTDKEWSELDAGAARLEPLDGNDSNGLSAANLRASGETANNHE